MAIDITDTNEAIDWGSIQAEAGEVTANTLWFLLAMIKQEEQRRNLALLEVAPIVRQDRIAMMAIYAP